MKTYELTWEDGYRLTVIGNENDLVDAMVKSENHGNVTSIEQVISYNRYTGSKKIRLA